MEKERFETAFYQELRRIENTSKNNLEYHSKAILVCQDHLSGLRQEVAGKGFKSVEEEITFFKKTKQVALHLLVYHSELKSFELEFPIGNRAFQKKYVRKEQEKRNGFFRSHSDFTQYMELGLTHLDRYFFTREFVSGIHGFHAVSCYRDPDFSTSHDLLLATLMANKKLLDHLEERLCELDKPRFKELPKSTLKWTSSKTALTELAYALYHGGAINNGHADIIEIAQALELIFNSPLGDVYRGFVDIRSRKKDRTKFLNMLTTSLITGMDRLDE